MSYETLSAQKKRRRISGPHPITEQDISGLNRVFTTSFSDRYRKDGMLGAHVPALNPRIWRYALLCAGEGAMAWKDERGVIVGFCLSHLSGNEGWMGPIALEPAYQGVGLGKDMVSHGIAFLQKKGARVIGLETMPRTMSNIGFYSGLGFLPTQLSITLAYKSHFDNSSSYTLLSQLAAEEKVAALAHCGSLLQKMSPGYDYSHEILITDALKVGDVLLFYTDGELDGYVLCHSAPLVEGRVTEELRVLKLVMQKETSISRFLASLADYARRQGCGWVALRLNQQTQSLYKSMIRAGARVRWTDLRMALDSFQEKPPNKGILISNWEI